MRVVLSLLAVAVAATGVIVAQGDYLDPAAGKSFTIAVVKDGPISDEGILELVREELSRLVTETELHLKEDPSFDAEWQAARAGEALTHALEDPEVDIILAVCTAKPWHCGLLGLGIQFVEFIRAQFLHLANFFGRLASCGPVRNGVVV